MKYFIIINFIYFLILFMYAFVIIHFGNNIKYLELELYMIINLRKCTKYDIIYMYSVNDTPDKFIKIIKKYCTIIPYNDDNITYNITDFKSSYTNFNTLRTCNFLFVYQLIKYEKICIIESDMIILKNIDNIFNLNTPSILTYYNNNKILENNIIKINQINILNECDKVSKCNGGIMLIKPSISIYNKLIENIKKIIEKKCIYPNETLFLLSYKKIYNLPFYFNGIKYYLDKFVKNNKDKLYIIHFNGKYKYIDYIKDNYLKDIKNKYKLLYYFLNEYKKKYYLVYNNEINNLIKTC